MGCRLPRDIPTCEKAREKRTAFLKLVDVTRVHHPGLYLLEPGMGGLGSWQKGCADVFKQQHRKGVGEELFLLIKGETKQNEGSPRKI